MLILVNIHVNAIVKIVYLILRRRYRLQKISTPAMPRLRTHQLQNNISVVRMIAVFEQINSLPGAKHWPCIADWD